MDDVEKEEEVQNYYAKNAQRELTEVDIVDEQDKNYMKDTTNEEDRKDKRVDDENN